MSSRGMFRNAQKGIKAKQLDAEGNEVSFDVREDEEMVRCGVLPICTLLWCRGTKNEHRSHAHCVAVPLCWSVRIAAALLK